MTIIFSASETRSATMVKVMKGTRVSKILKRFQLKHVHFKRVVFFPIHLNQKSKCNSTGEFFSPLDVPISLHFTLP